MAHLVLVIISIMLTSSVVMTFIVYNPAEILVKKSIYDGGIKNMEMTRASIQNYLRDVARKVEVDEKGIPADVTLESLSVGAIIPKYGYFPASPSKYFKWEIQRGLYQEMPAIGVCFYATNDAPPFFVKVLPLIKKRLPAEGSVLGSSCFSGSDSTVGTHLTFWEVASHYAVYFPPVANPADPPIGSEEEGAEVPTP